MGSGDPAPLPKKGAEPPIFGLCCGQMALSIKMKLGMEVGLSPGHIELGGDPAPHSPQFSPPVYCGQMTGWIQMTLGIEVGLGPCHIVLDGDPAPLPKRGQRRPQFSAHFYCGQTVGCIKMPLGMEVGLSPGDTHSHPIFGPCVLWPNGWPR